MVRPRYTRDENVLTVPLQGLPRFERKIQHCDGGSWDECHGQGLDRTEAAPSSKPGEVLADDSSRVLNGPLAAA